MSCHLSFAPFITANNADITVGGNTNLKGSLIAAGNYDENGNFVDNGNLNLTTNTLTFSNLNSTSYSTNTSVGGGVSLNQNKQGETLPNASSVTYDASSGISYSKEKTLATIGSGNLTITDKENSDDITKLNRNTDNLTKELYSGGVSSDVSATIDMRMFTEDGRKDIAEDIVKAGMVVSTIEKIATNATVSVTDFFKETEKQYITYETIKQKIQTDPELAKILSNPALSEEAKNIIINAVTNQVMIELGYTPTENNLIATTEPGRDGVQIEGFYSLETKEGYINDLYNLSNYDLLSTAGTETQRAMDDQDNWDFSDESLRGDRSLYAQDFGESIADYTDFILSQNDYGSLSTTANPLVTPSDNVLANNAEFAGLDKELGDNEPYEDPRIFAGTGIHMEDASMHNYSAEETDRYFNYITMAFGGIGIVRGIVKYGGKYIVKLASGETVVLDGKWIATSESMSKAAAEYQSFITGKAAQESFLVNGVKFDGEINGILIDAKSGYSNFVNKSTGDFYDWFKGGNSLINQAERQLKASNGTKIQWYFENAEAMKAVQKLFNKNDIKGIELIYKGLK